MRLSAICFGVICLAPLSLLSQSSSTLSLPPGFVDGSKNPAQVPDYAAYRLVMMHLSSVMNATDARAAVRQVALLKQIGLSDTDTQVLKNGINSFSASYTQWQMRFATASTSAEAYAAANAIALAARDGLIQTMTADGVSRFVQYVQQEKTRMIVKP
jgi:hypothetical protein